jgi:hypothetical protein
MPTPSASPTRSTASILPDPHPMRLRVIELADGDAGMSTQIRMMMWDTYSTAGSPLGPTEEGMFEWWEYDQLKTPN